MSLGVLNNISAIYAQNNLNQTQSALNTTLQQLSSGSRINSGADDAAGDGPERPDVPAPPARGAAGHDGRVSEQR